MSTPPPIKPPRGMKQGRETSGLLMSVIRTLSASETNEQRDREKAKLEKEYKKCDQKLDELVSLQNNELAQVMQVFGGVSGVVGACRLRVRGARARLAGCKELLCWRRAELHRLAKEGAQHRHALLLLTQIDQLTGVGAELNAHLSKGYYLNAATVLQNGLVTAQTSLCQVEALQHLRTDMEAKKQMVYNRVLTELNTALYRVNTEENGPKNQNTSRKQELPRGTNFQTEEEILEITPQLELKITEENKTLNLKLALLIESLATISKVKESIEVIKVQMQSELLEVISIASQQVLDFGTSQIPVLQSQIYTDSQITEMDMSKREKQDAQAAQPLVDLMGVLLQQCRVIAERHKVLLEAWKNLIKKHNITGMQLYSMHHYWSRVQAVLQLLLTDYLDIQSLKTGPQRLVYQEQPVNFDINSYFVKKKPQSKKKGRLLKLNMSSGGGGGVEQLGGGGAGWKLVCTPSAQHLAHIYHLLDGFLAHVESNTGVAECSLRVFLAELVRGAQAERVAGTLRALVAAHCGQPSAWRELLMVAITPHNNKTLFKCAVAVWEACEWALRDALRLGAMGGGVVRGAVIPTLTALATAARRRTAQLAPRAKSHHWLGDEDITRFLKSLPNWNLLKSPPVKGRKDFEIIEEDMKQSFEREAEILGSSLGDGNVDEKEIISNVNTLRDIAIMCETMEWLATKVKGWEGLEEGVVKKEGKERRPNSYDALLVELSATAASFHYLSDNCLLLLHLEVRMQCFHYLGRLNSWLLNGQTGESPTVCLARTLQAFFQQLGPILQHRRLHYVMEGLGEMMSAVVVGGWRGSGEGVTGAVAQLEPLRHCLTAAHLSPEGLHKATLYLHMLNMSHEEILLMVAEKGPAFSELEYMNAFQVIAKSANLPDSILKANLSKLSNLLGHLGVTV